MKNKIIISIVMVSLLVPGVGCKKYLNVNSDPDTPQEPSPSSVMPAMLAAMTYGLQRDGRYISHYIANFHTYSSAIADANYDNHGYIYSSTNMGDLWWMAYFSMGNNLNYITEKGLEKQQYDHVAAAYALKAWAFQSLTDEHADIIFTEAWRDTTYYFHYNPQDEVYRGVDSLCRVALHYLDTSAVMPANTLRVGDYTYNGDLTRWRKFVYGILARNYHHISNKAGLYNPDSVIKFCDNSFSSVGDDFVVPFDGTKNENANFWGPYRNNMSSFRQSNFIVRLLDGSTFTGSNAAVNRDPRLSHMLCASSDTTNGNGGYYGVDPGSGEQYVALNPPNSYLVNGQPPTSGTALTNWKNARKKTVTPWGDSAYTNPASGVINDVAGKYLFKNKAVMPVMTYSELQFIKAEAALRKNDLTKAYTAYLNGINAHFDFINKSYSSYRGNSSLFNNYAITAADRARYLASGNVKQTAGTLTLTDIMLQKYIALWGWGFLETWVDLRRFHYIDLDPATGQQVYKNYLLPATFFGSNGGKPVYRIRPNYQSEYVWNLAELQRLGGTKSDYHTLECWFSLP
ncbi:hypothetical protein A3860_27490 [Niastella vici]|uniref:SusD/RagB family nutrient-binding outer membrane lipoprotein n=1 Tax=Niastella vici TaxID=1703345 RepID=A0A1V9FWP0_9BACT|nr:SusD/RagB family nutrient-binding outer membrane lipoprotein [Niastella vici]OQP62753.1 hypothetical protein A3860_27490 [Niastella vici]